jgi:hypothetical protein
VSLNRQTYKLPDSFSRPFEAAREDWKKNEKVRRLWQSDASLWTGTDENKWLGWLGITQEQLAHISALHDIAADIKKPASNTRFFWVWAAPACVRKFCA